MFFESFETVQNFIKKMALIQLNLRMECETEYEKNYFCKVLDIHTDSILNGEYKKGFNGLIKLWDKMENIELEVSKNLLKECLEEFLVSA